jgi:hypothetical protein
VAPPDQCLEASQIFTRLADRLGLIPDIPDDLHAAARADRMTFGAALMEFAGQVPEALSRMPFVLAKTLGLAWGSAAKAGLWGMLMTAPKAFRKNAARAGFEPGIDQGDRIFQALLGTPEGLWVGKADADNPMDGIKTPSGRIEVFIEELETGVLGLTPEKEDADLAMPAAFPLVLNTGRHMQYNINIR